MAAPGAELLVVCCIPPALRAAHLRAHFSQFTETGAFDCFHYRHRPQGEPGGGCCCLVSVRPGKALDLVRMYSGRHWTGQGGAVVAGPRCVIRRVKTPPPCADSDAFPYKTRKQLQSKQAGSDVFTQLDMKKLPELNPPALMPQGNVGTPTKVFLELIQACRLPPRLITKLQLQFPRTGSSRRYGRVPFDYQDCEMVEQEEGVYNASGEEIPRGLAADGKLTGETEVVSALPDGKSAHPEEECSEAGEESHSDDDNDTCEEWERHEALHEDVTNQERTEERLFEERIELKWEKGGSGLVFYTDAQYWHAEEGDFDEQTADDWDVDMSVYYDQEAGDKDARDSVRMRLEQRRRDGIEDDASLGKPVGKFEQHTKGIGRKVMEQQGWMEGHGLGSRGAGIPEALDNDGQNPRCKRGLGYRGEKLQTFLAVKKPRNDENIFISTVYDDPREVDCGDLLLRRQLPVSMKYRTSQPTHLSS
ncbi:G patch domain-containing protein 3 [Ambystoma mexicanum]|uniref:G patch domain-containing protein 3 n=1 Tax=Ambystoma mexicanum TaxID=8296 RepID=UPI0037E788E8